MFLYVKRLAKGPLTTQQRINNNKSARPNKPCQKSARQHTSVPGSQRSSSLLCAGVRARHAILARVPAPPRHFLKVCALKSATDLFNGRAPARAASKPLGAATHRRRRFARHHSANTTHHPAHQGDQQSEHRGLFFICKKPELRRIFTKLPNQP